MPQINFRVDKETWFYLHSLDNYSKYIKDLIAKDRESSGDLDFINLKLDKLKQQIKDLQTFQSVAREQIEVKHKIVLEAGSVFKDLGRKQLTDNQNILWIRSVVMPKIKKENIKIKEEELLEIFKNL